MGRYALVITATGVVDNVIEYNGVREFNPPSGQELREADSNTEIGGTWDGSAFVRAPAYVPTRTEVLMNEMTVLQKWDVDADTWVDKTDSEIAAEKLELKNLLLAELQAGDLNQQRTQMLLRLERG